MSNGLSRPCLAAFVGACLLHTQAYAQTTLETFAGGGTFIESPGTTVPTVPRAIATGNDGYIYVSDLGFGRFVRFNPATGNATALPGVAGQRELQTPQLASMAFDAQGTLHITISANVLRYDLTNGSTSLLADAEDGLGFSDGNMTIDGAGDVFVPEPFRNKIVRITAAGQAQTWVNASESAGFSGDGGPALSAALNSPTAVLADAAGNLYIADSFNNRIRFVSAATGIITTIAGTGGWSPNGDGLPALQTNLWNPRALALGPDGALFIYEEGMNRVRRMAPGTGIISAYAGNNAHGFSGDGGPATSALISSQIEGLATDAQGNLYIADLGNKRVRRVNAATGVITTVLGNGTDQFCGENLPRLDICLQLPAGVVLDAQDNVYISDSLNYRIRKVSSTTGLVTTIAGNSVDEPHGGDGGPATLANFGAPPRAVALDAMNNVYVAVSHRVRRINAATGIITTIAGSFTAGDNGDGGPAFSARLREPTNLIFDAAGNAFIADTGNHKIRRVDAVTGVITTYAGTGQPFGALGDYGPATAASLYRPQGLAFDKFGNLLVADRLHYRIRKIDRNTGVIQTVAGNGMNVHGPDNDFSSRGIGEVHSIAVDSAGLMYLGSFARIRKIDQWDVINTVAGIGTTVVDSQGLSIRSPAAMDFDSLGRLYVAEESPYVVRRLSGLPGSPVDSTPPIVEPVILSGTLGNDGWYTSDVRFGFVVTEREGTVHISGFCTNRTLSEDTAGQTVTCTATSLGGTTTRSITLKRDTTPPVVSFAAPSPAASPAGWHNTNVAIPFTVSDAMSGVGSSPPSPVTITGEGAALAGSVTVTDVAGNSTTIASPDVSIDRTPPVLTFTLPAAGAVYGAFTTPVAQYSCSDALSGIAACTGTLPNGTTIATNTSGNFNFQVNVTDNAGNVAAASRGFSVATMVFERWIEPIRRSPTYNGITAGSLVPIRWRLLDGAGGVVSNLAAFQSITPLTFGCQTAVPLTSAATGGPGLSHNAATGVFTYNWQTDASWTGCRRVQLRFSNNSVAELVFRFQ